MIQCLPLWSIILVLSLLLQWHCATCFLVQRQPKLYKSTTTTTTSLHGTLSRSVIVNSAKRKQSKRISTANVVSKAFLMEAMDEALFRQDLILQALATEQQKNGGISSTNHSVLSRKEQVSDTTSKLQVLKEQLSKIENDCNYEDLERFKTSFASLGFASIMKQSPDHDWKMKRGDSSSYGRPRGFEDGLVFYTPKGVPILVGRPKSHKDETLRRVSQGADLWFQVEDYNGSRVLLRTSLKKGLRGSKECIQMAADLAARYSDSYYNINDSNNKVPVMYCDSKKVAKRGSKIGQMRQQKSLGRLFGDPRNVEEMTRGASL